MRPFAALLVFGLVATSAGAGAPAADEVRRDEEARLRAALSTRSDPRLLSSLGALLAEERRFGEALPLLREATAAAPGNAGFRKNLANALFAAGDPTEGERELVAALAVATELRALVRNGRRLLGSAGRDTAAVRFAEAALAKAPSDPALREEVALAALRQGDRERTERIYSDLLLRGEIDPARAGELRRFVSLCRLARRPDPRRYGEAPARPRSALLVTLDTTRADAIGGRSPRSSRTPDLSRLVGESTDFREVRSAAPVTLPSHAAILTSRFGPSTGVRNNGVDALPDGIPTLAEAAKASGLRTAAFVSSWVLERRFGLARGFDRYDDEFVHPKQKRRRFPVDRSGAETVSHAAAWLRSLAPGEAFFGWIHLYDPHSDYSPPPPFDEAFADRPYSGEVAFADLCVGYLLGELSRLGRDAETLVVVTADHGEGLGEHGENTHGLFVYDSTLRVPLLIRDPSRGARAGSIARPARTVDLFPTIADRLGIPVPPGIAGESLGPLLMGGHLSAPPIGFAETLIPADFGWAALRTAFGRGRKLILAPKRELYDLRRDPVERTSLSPDRDSESLERFLLGTLAASSRTNRSPLDEEAVGRLRSLGYFASGGDAPSPASFDPAALSREVDPKDRLESFRTYQVAASLEDDRRIVEALPLADRLLATDPGSPFFLSFRGSLRESSGDAAGAANDYAAAAAAAPNDARYRFIRAVLAHRAGDLRAAERSYREALALDPSHFLAHYDLGRLLLESGRFDDGERETRAALAISPEHPEARNNLGYVLIRRDRDFTRGIAEIRRAVAASPRNPLLRDSLASALWNGGRKDEARLEMTEALRLARGRELDAASSTLIAAHAREIGIRANLGGERSPE